MAAGGSYSIVEYFGGDGGYRCGYCKQETGNFSHGMWSHTMTVQDYQDLIDRGWRRSGKYVYKPVMDKTCCPQYTIRCHALNFHPSKTHKKTLKKVNRFLSKGEMPVERHDEGREGEPMVSVHEEGVQPPPQDPLEIDHSDVQDISTSPDTDTTNSAAPTPPREDAVPAPEEKTPNVTPKPGKGADPSRPLGRKAKDIRKERRLQKEQQKQQEAKSSSVDPSPSKSSSNQPKSLEEFITESLPNDPLHRLEVRLVPVSFEDPDFLASYKQSAAVYARYQMTVHGDAPYECGESEAIKTRFAPVLESRETLLAVLTLPKFKVRWIGGANRREAARALLIAECRTLPHDAEPAENKNREVAAHSSANENDFFFFW